MANPWAIEPSADEGLVDVLYIGSDSDLADMYRLKLELDGYRVRILDTLRGWSGSRPDLVFIDLEHSDGSGYGELTRLRSDRRLRDVPAILLVSESAGELAARGMTLTAQDYVLHARPSVAFAHAGVDLSPPWSPGSASQNRHAPGGSERWSAGAH